jgi:hypothetical protein
VRKGPLRAARPHAEAGFTIFESLIDDGTAPLKPCSSTSRTSRAGSRRKTSSHSGVASFGHGRVLQMENPQLGLDEPDPLGRIVPIYRKLGPRATPSSQARGPGAG